MSDAPASAPLVRVRLDIAYDGTAFSGWAAQPNLRTVQGTLEDALRILYRDLPEGPLLTVAGRTDAGVHALGQVAHLDLDAERFAGTVRRASDTDAPTALARRLAGVLGADADVAIVRASVAPQGFDARFSALSRTYEYRIADLETPANPLERHRTTLVRARLDVDAMNAAARILIGLHDFAGFCKPRPHATTVRTLQRFEWRRDAAGAVIADVQADAFCHSMVRSLVGMCAAVGQGRLALERVPALLELGERSNAFPVLAARGLTLVGVGYPDDAQLEARQVATRARRPAVREGLRLVVDEFR